MTYQVLARKWRPRIFRDMVGQEHVLKALINALDHKRLHHAYLFTGTRGVGKTTIGRILAKCLNCDVGITSQPCDQCNTCIAINEGRFVDLIEIDAASKTKVEDTRDLLNNVPYSPASGRYKVYLIDEVHMLSNSSFNALLKTLEEPPAHVKFLLATTDPQKLPATVLSRCLQFNLKHISPEKIVEYLRTVLTEEKVTFEDAGLWQLARAADGSMRDALSLTDQAIAYSDNNITEKECSAMLGNIDSRITYDLLAALSDNDGKRLLSTVANLAEYCSDFTPVLSELLVALHRVAIAQSLPDIIDNSLGDRQDVIASAQRLTAEDVQLFYQIALLGKRDLSLAPNSRSGLEMVLLRMLTFKLQGTNDWAPTHTEVKNIEPEQNKPHREAEKKTDLPAQPGKITRVTETTKVPETNKVTEITKAKEITKVLETTTVAEVTAAPEKVPFSQFTATHWLTVYSDLTIKGLLQTAISHCAFSNKQDKILVFILDEDYSALYDDRHQQRLAELLTDYFAETVQVRIDIGKIAPEQETPATYTARCQQQLLLEAENAIANDTLVNQLINQFNAEIIEGSIAPIAS